MKSALCYLIFFVMFLPETFAKPGKLTHLSGGGPGCWDTIRTAALTTEELNQLSPDCQNLREDYLGLIKEAEDHPAESLAKLNLALKNAKKAAPPYEAILLSALSTSPEIEKGLQDRALIERHLKLPFRYADAALFHLQGNPCEERKEFRHPFYREVCTARDSILSSRMTILNHGPHSNGKK